MINKQEIKPGKSVMSEMTHSGNAIPLYNSSPGVFVMSRVKCYECGIEKGRDGYYKSSFAGGRIKLVCKSCLVNKAIIKRRTKLGLIKSLYQNNKKNTTARNFINIGYTQQELIDWCLSQSLFHKLYWYWVDSEYSKGQKPTIDRINDYGGYEFNNIQLLTWEDNFKKYLKGLRTDATHKRLRPVMQYELNGNLIGEYKSIKKAMEETGIIHICLCCQGKRKTAGGYNWKYKDKV